MPATKSNARRPSGTATARARDNDRRLERVTKSLEAAQKDLTAIGGSMGAGVIDLRQDVKRLLRDAGRDVGKMRDAVQRDLVRLQKDLAKAAKPASRRRPAAKATKPAPKRRTAARSR